MKKLLPLIAVLALAGAGCASATPPTPSTATSPTGVAAKYDSCLLFTKADAEAVLGETVNGPTPDKTLGTSKTVITSGCTYTTTAAKPSDIKVAYMLLRKARDLAEANKVFDEAIKLSKSISGVDPVEVQGLGDRAFWAGGALNQLNVLKGDVLLVATVRDTKSGTMQQQATETIRRALDNMNRL